MQAVIAVLLALVALANADCGRLERLKVKSQWVEAYGTGMAREKLVTKAFNKFFRMHPETREALFARVHGNNVNSKEFRAHGARVLGGLDMCISLLDDEATMNAQLGHLKGQHDPRGVTAEYFKDFGEALLDAVAEKLGRHFDRAAFGACYGVIIAGIGP